MRKPFLLCLLLLAATVLTGQDSKESLIQGLWLNSKATAHIKIEKVNQKFQGKIVWMKEPLNEKGETKTDKNNPDKDKRDKPIMGMYILKGFVYAGNGKWEDGTIYDPEVGKVYSCEINMNNPSKLEVRGYIGIALIGRTDVWTRVKAH